MEDISDDELLARLNGTQAAPQVEPAAASVPQQVEPEVSDDELLARLNGGAQSPSPEQPTALAQGASAISKFLPTGMQFSPEAAQSGLGVVQDAGNAATAASQQLGQGFRDVTGNMRLSLRNVSDSLGFTDPNQTAQERYNLKAQGLITDAASRELGHPIIGDVANVVGHYGPAVALGAATGGTSIASQMLGGALQNGLTDTGSASGQVWNTGIGAMLGLATGGFFKWLGTYKFTPDPAKRELFESRGIKPFASQLESNPAQAAKLSGIEQSLTKLPGFLGTGPKAASQVEQVKELLPQVMKQLQDGAVPSKPLYQAAVDSPQIASQMMTANSVAKAAEDGLKRLGNLKEVEDITKKKLAELAQNTPMNMGQLQSERMGIAQSLGKLGKLPGATAQEVRSVLRNVRQAMSDDLTGFANANGVGETWKAADKAFSQEKIIETLSNIATKANDLHDPTLSGNYNIKQFTRNAKDALSKLDDMGIKVPQTVTDAIDGVRKLTAMMTGPNAIKPVKGVVAQSTLGTIQAAAGYFGAAHPYLGIPLGMITMGARMLVSTTPGIQVLAAVSKGNHAALRMAGTLAVTLGAIGYAHHLQDIGQHNALDEMPTDNGEQ